MKQKLYYFVFKDKSGKRIAVRAYLDFSETQARKQAIRDTYTLKSYTMTRAVGANRCMTFG